MACPVHILSGFLGTGKTTAIRAQLEAHREKGERLAVIVNDFGEAGFDEAAIGEGGAATNLVSIPGGCVCCTAPEGFVGALGAVLEQAPDRILIEPTGLARPQDLVDTIRRGPHREKLDLQPVIVLVDPERLEKADEEERALIEAQAEAADVLVANRTDLASPAAIEAFERWAISRWPDPLAIVKTRNGVIPEAQMQWPEGFGPRLDADSESHSHAHAHAHVHSASAAGPSTQGFEVRSFRFAPSVVFERDRVLALATGLAKGELGASPLRMKGVFRTREGVIQVELAGGTLHERGSGHRADSRIDAIFRAADEVDFGALEQALESAILTEEEARAQANQIELVLPDGRTEVLDRARLASLPDGLDDVSVLFPKRAGQAARVGALFDAVGADRGGHAVVCAADGFASEPVGIQALCEGVLIHSVDGEPLADGQGGPFRLMIPEGVPDAPSACANVKGVIRIVVRDAAAA